MKKVKKKIKAAILIIGNEVLSGRTQDLNVSFISNWLNINCGISVEEVRIIPDIEKKIIFNILDLSKKFKYVFTKKGASQVGGFGAIGGLFPDTWDWTSFWQTTALISIILAFMNILPIPALDGGHVMFLLYEMISGRKPNDKFMEFAQMAGFFLLIALVLFANGNDIYRYFFGG